MTSESEQTERHPQSYRGRFPDWALVLISALSICLSPVSYSGNRTVFQFLYDSGWLGFGFANFVYSTLILSLVTGFIPFAILLRRKKYSYVLLLALLGFLDVGILLIFGILLALTDPGLSIWVSHLMVV